jgi:hypothetical protein
MSGLAAIGRHQRPSRRGWHQRASSLPVSPPSPTSPVLDAQVLWPRNQLRENSRPFKQKRGSAWKVKPEQPCYAAGFVSAIKSPRGREVFRELHCRREVKRLSALLSPPSATGMKMIERRCESRQLLTAMTAFVVITLVNFYPVLSYIVKISLCF